VRLLHLPEASPTNIGFIAAQEGQAGFATDAWFQSYHPLADHVQFLYDLVDAFPNNSAIVSSGISGQGTDITGINIFGSGGSGSKPAIVIHGTVHAREWIGTMVSPATVLVRLRAQRICLGCRKFCL